MEAVTGADLSFVNLGITIQHLPNSITVFGFRIAFYGIIIGLGMLAGMAIAFSDARRRGQDPDVYLDFALYGIIFSIIGARAYYVIFGIPIRTTCCRYLTRVGAAWQSTEASSVRSLPLSCLPGSGRCPFFPWQTAVCWA